jgi:hypothetical protein
MRKLQGKKEGANDSCLKSKNDERCLAYITSLIGIVVVLKKSKRRLAAKARRRVHIGSRCYRGEGIQWGIKD